jgi:hypothetical protein
MAEDSGTFKTYQAYLRRICRFVIRKTTVAPLHHGAEIAWHRELPGTSAPNLRERVGIVAVCSNQPDSPQL